MPDERRHRGAHPLDARLFDSEELPRLREAVSDYCWLLGRGYAARSSLALIGDRFQLHERQRKAVMRAACSASARTRRAQGEVQSIMGQTLYLDGYNVLTTLEAALSGGLIVHACDGCYRDIASLHGTFRSVEETLPAIEIVGEMMLQQGATRAVWLLDSPVSNSGRLKTTLREIAAGRGWDWEVELVFNPDAELIKTEATIATADSVILDAGGPWFNLVRRAVDERVPEAWILDLSLHEVA